MLFEYLVCTSQQNRVTHVNGEWTGSEKPHKETHEAYMKVLDTCPRTWEFLSEKGTEGWDLVAVTSSPVRGEVITGFLSDEIELTHYGVLYLKRAG